MFIQIDEYRVINVPQIRLIMRSLEFEKDSGAYIAIMMSGGETPIHIKYTKEKWDELMEILETDPMGEG